MDNLKKDTIVTSAINMRMSNDLAERLLRFRIDKIKESLETKAKEYVRGGDRMHNFNVGAEKKGWLREEVIESFRLKHDISRDDIISDMKEGKLPTREYVEEKYGDIINYYILEEMSIKQKIMNDGKGL